MKVGDLIYDSHYGLYGLVTEVSECTEFCAVMYEDGVFEGRIDAAIRGHQLEVVDG